MKIKDLRCTYEKKAFGIASANNDIIGLFFIGSGKHDTKFKRKNFQNY